MRKKNLINLSAIILGVLMCFGLSKVQATEITSTFTGETITRSNLQAVSAANTFSANTTIVPITLGVSKSEYKTNNGDFYWTIKDSNQTYKDLYCLNLERGFGAPNGSITEENNTKIYENQYDLNTITDTNYTNFTGLSSQNKNKILWILNNSATSEDDITILLSSASTKVNINSIGLVNKDIESFIKNDMQSNTRESTKLTFDDIKMVQQIAIWHYTNSGGIFDNTIGAICDSNGNQISSLGQNIDTDGYGTYIRSGMVKQAKINALYQYFIDGAESGSSSTVIPTLTLSNSNASVSESGSDYIVGPFSLVGTNKEKIKEIVATLNKNFTLLNSSKEEVTDNRFSQVIGNEFYLKIAKNEITENTTNISIKLNYTYDIRTSTLLTNSTDPTNTQPVVLVETKEMTSETTTSATIQLTSVSVEKIWNDNTDQDGKRAEYGVTLYANGTAYSKEVKLNKDTLTYTWKNLLKYKDGKEIKYTVVETTVPDGYTASYSNDTFTITNSYTPETIDINGTKTWDDSENQDGKRPASITVNLLANGTKMASKTVTAPWTYSFTNLPKYQNGTEIVYTIDEEAVPEYTKTINGYNITNTYTPGIVEKTATKIWEDGNDSDGIRPTSIEVQLYKTVNGTKTSMGDSYKVTLNAENNWTYTWENLSAKENGNIITYTAEEVDVPNGYIVSYSEDTFTITNTHVPKDLAIQLQKIDEQGNIITSSEATFEITGTQNITDTTNDGILDLDSQKLLSNSFEFIYTIKETNAPIGYNKVDGELSVKIAGTTKLENGSYVIDTIEITDKDGNPLDNTKIMANYNSELNTVVIKVINTKKSNEYSVQLLKVGEDGTTPISGAWFKINDGQANLISETGNEIAKGTLSENGELNLTYKLEETVSPDGYIKIDGAKEVKINAKVELKDNEYQITEANLINELEGITISEENNLITIKVKNEVEVTGKYNVLLRKVDENGNILTGAKFEVNGTEYELSTGEVKLIENKDLTSTNDIDLSYTLKETVVPEGYEQIPDKTIYIKAKIQKDGNNYKLIRAELVDSEGNIITDEAVSIKVESDTIVITVKNTPIQKKFDLSLRKFITKVNDIEYSREPVVDTSTIATTGTATYKHIKQPIPVQKGDVVTYTIRVYNEGELDGYVNKITDHLPENLIPILRTTVEDIEKYEDEIEFNENWLWGGDNNIIATEITTKGKASDLPNIIYNETETEAEKEAKQNDARLLKSAYNEDGTIKQELDYIDVQIKCLVTDKAVSGEYLTNIAEITDSQDINGVQGDGSDSELSNADISNLADYKNQEAITSTEDSYIPGQEDDDDFEKLVVKEFDLSLRKFITKVNETSYSREPVVDTSKLGTIIDGKIITTAIYNHSKEPVIVETNDVVTYTIRIYNEGSLAGYANEITDDIPEGLEFLPNSSVNVSYKWKMLDSEGNETEDVSKAVMIVTDYLSDSDKNNIINAVSENDGVKTLSYKDVEVQFKVIAKAKKLKDNVIKNVAQISADSDRDIDSNPNRDEKYDYTTGNNEDDIDYEPIKLQYFDLALRKFITKVNTTEYNNRYPEIVYNEDGSITYKHTKDPVLVTTNDVVVYTIRVYNEGEKAGYATEITDNLPDGLEFLPENEINKQYGWKLIDSEGNETQDITKAVKFTTDCLKDELVDSLVVENGQKILSYKDVQIAFKVIEPNTSDRILVNTAEISADSDDDVDSTPNNQIETEDDLDKEYVKVQYFDLSLKKWVTKTMVTYNGKTTTTKTGFTEDSEEIAKVDLVASRMKKTTVKFAYNIKVTNEGELPGYAYEVKDYIPKGLKFVAEDNKDWKEIKDGVVVTEKLKDTLLNPGESATVEIILTWQNSTTNTGLKTNYAEISKDSADDIDSTPDNYNLKEDDIDDAQVILSIKTAGPQTYVGLILLSVAILAGGIFLIKKYVIK